MSDAFQGRAARRRDTQARILDAARLLFAQRGFERTTIRAIAAAAGVDPALVMQYFGSKQELFSQVSSVIVPEPAVADPDQLIEHMLTTLGMKIGEIPQSSLAMLRSMLTHPEAADAARATLDRQVEGLVPAIPATDAEVRAGLMVSVTVGVVIAQHLLGLTALRGATAQQVTDLLRPCIQSLAAQGRQAAGDREL